MSIDTRELIDEANALVGGDWENIDEEVTNELDEDEAERLETLIAFLREIGDEAQYGVALIPEDEFEDYARQLAEDIGAIPEDNNWPCYCIDWKRAARELRVDYSLITFDGDDYLYRA